MALLTLGVVFANFFKRGASWAASSWWCSTIPIAMLVNAIRVALTGILTHHYGQEAAQGAIHDFQGIITFGLAFVLLMAESRPMDLVVGLRRRSGPRPGGGARHDSSCAAALAFIGLNFYMFHHLATEDVIPPRTCFDAFPISSATGLAPSARDGRRDHRRTSA